MGHRPTASRLCAAGGSGTASGTDELRAAFSDGWSITSIEAEQSDLNPSGLGILSAQTWLASIKRTGQRDNSGGLTQA